MSETTPKVSIIMPVYNGDAFLKDSIGSILCQTFHDFELLLIDDGSTDGSGATCRNFQQNDERIRYVHQKNGGISSARNHGLRLAQGEWCTFCDCDDRYEPDLLKDNLEILEKNSADIVKFGWYKDYVKLGRSSGTDFLRNSPYAINYDHFAEHYDELRKMSFVYVWDALFRLSFLREHNIWFDETMKYGAEDHDFNIACLSARPDIVVNTKRFYHHIFHGENISTKFNEERIKSLEIVTKKEFDLINRFYDNRDMVNKSIKTIKNERIRFVCRYLKKSKMTLSERTNILKSFIEENGFSDIVPVKKYSINGILMSFLWKNKLYGVILFLSDIRNWCRVLLPHSLTNEKVK